MFEVSWLVPQRVILAHSISHINRDELANGIQKVHHMIQASDNMVHCIIDNRQLRKLQTKVSDILAICSHMPFNGWLLTINANYEGQHFSNILTTRHLPRRTQSFSTLQTAIRFLQDEDVSLSNLAHYIMPLSVKQKTQKFR